MADVRALMLTKEQKKNITENTYNKNYKRKCM
jgi:hypothetical protein